MSKTEFYEKSGVSSASLSQWNNGQRFPSLRSLKRIANCLDMPVEDLVSNNSANINFKEEGVEALSSMQELSESQSELWEIISALDDRQCRRLTNILENILQMVEDSR
ncbi:MAG: helix-turn-helix transcriptional regulator [Oscillospiraceae bacterium]|nr:helix-turn-helix transcriptional regulator [Oscillospiraceae bacterium]